MKCSMGGWALQWSCMMDRPPRGMYDVRVRGFPRALCEGRLDGPPSVVFDAIIDYNYINMWVKIKLNKRSKI